MPVGLKISLWLGSAMALMIAGAAIGSLAVILLGGALVVAFFAYGFSQG